MNGTNDTLKTEKKTMVILGSGQFGRAAAALINASHYSLIAYGDNNSSLHGTFIAGTPVVSVEDAVALNPDCVLIGVTDKVRSDELRHQAAACGFNGNFLLLGELHELIDIRKGVICRLAERLRALQTDGNIAELGVYKGELAAVLNALFPEKTIYLFDTFTGFDARDIDIESDSDYSHAKAGDFSDTGETAVLNKLPFPEKAIIRKGFFPDTARGLENELYAFVSLDADLYAPTLAGLEYFYPRLNKGGVIILHDYNNSRFSGVKHAVEDYEQKHGALALVPLCDLHGSAVIVKQ